MKAAVYSRNGGPEVLEFADAPDPGVGPGTVLIRVHYIALQGADVRKRREVAPANAAYIVGYQAAGIVEAIGSDVTQVAPGDRVVGFALAGSHAELFAVAERHTYKAPDGLDLAVAATLPVEFGTASDALFELGGLVAGERVLVRGAAGGVGLAAVQLAKRQGAFVIASAARASRLDQICDLGADIGIDYEQHDVAARTLEITEGRGVELVIDMVGGEPLLTACARRGRYGAVGRAGAPFSIVRVGDLVNRSLTVFGLMFGDEMATPRVHALVARLMEQAMRGEIQLPVARIFRLAEAADAHAFVERERPVGRVLLDARPAGQ
jgi:NADPH2:quinone reductase